MTIGGKAPSANAQVPAPERLQSPLDLVQLEQAVAAAGPQTLHQQITSMSVRGDAASGHFYTSSRRPGNGSRAARGPGSFGKLRGMTKKGYTVLGWLAYQILSRVVGRKLAQNKVKLGAAATVALVLVGGILAAKTASSDD